MSKPRTHAKRSSTVTSSTAIGVRDAEAGAASIKERAAVQRGRDQKENVS